MKLKMSVNSELIPVTPDDKKALEALKGNDILICKKESNSPSAIQIRQFWKVAQVMVENEPEFVYGKEAAHYYVDKTKVKLGYSIPVMVNGVHQDWPEHMNFNSMKQDRRNEVINAIYNDWAIKQGCSVEELIDASYNNA